MSFLGKLDGSSQIPFEKFVLDTRYTVNLLALTIFVILVGGLFYVALSAFLKSKELYYFVGQLKRLFVSRKISPIPAKAVESVTPEPNDPNTP